MSDNRAKAKERLVSLEKRLLKTPEVAERYEEVMNANIEKGYAKKVDSQSQVAGPAWYLPHFPVIREDKQTTKVRIVFDSAARDFPERRHANRAEATEKSDGNMTLFS